MIINSWGGGSLPTIDFIKNKSDTIYPITILDAIYDINGLNIKQFMDSKYQPKGSYSLSSHNHDDRYYTESEINNKLAGYQPKGSYSTTEHNHDSRYYIASTIDTKLNGKANTSHTHSYLPLSGGTLTGALKFANGTWNPVGDDVVVGDMNVAGAFCIKGANAISALAFMDRSSNSTYQLIKSDGNNMTITKNVNIEGNATIAGKRITTVAVENTAGNKNINTYDKWFTIANYEIPTNYGTSLRSYGLVMTVDGIGTPFQIYIPDNGYIISKKNKTSGTFTNLWFNAVQSSSPNTQLLWAW